MGKIQVDHRVVVRDGSGHITSNQDYPDFSQASPAYQAALKEAGPDQEVTLQHGARIVFRSCGGLSNQIEMR